MVSVCSTSYRSFVIHRDRCVGRDLAEDGDQTKRCNPGTGEPGNTQWPGRQYIGRCAGRVGRPEFWLGFAPGWPAEHAAFAFHFILLKVFFTLIIKWKYTIKNINLPLYWTILIKVHLLKLFFTLIFELLPFIGYNRKSNDNVLRNHIIKFKRRL